MHRRLSDETSAERERIRAELHRLNAETLALLTAYQQIEREAEFDVRPRVIASLVAGMATAVACMGGTVLMLRLLGLI